MGINLLRPNWNWRNSLSMRSQTDYIALHHAQAVTCSAYDIDRWHKNNGWSGIGYHFFVRKDGSIYCGRPLNALGAHVTGMNDRSIGICAEGDYHNVDTNMPQAQKHAIAELLDYLKTNYYPNAKIVGHREIGSSDCPGKYYPLEELRNYKNILSNKEELTMMQYEELKNRIVALETESQRKNTVIAVMGQEIQDLYGKHAVYNTIDEVPEYFREAVQKKIDSGVLKGDENGNLGLSPETVREWTIDLREEQRNKAAVAEVDNHENE